MSRGQLPNITFDRTAGSHPLAAAGHRGVGRTSALCEARVVRRRLARLTSGIVLLLLVGPYGAADAQAAAKLWRIGFLDQGSVGNPYFEAFQQGLRDLGWVEGRTIKVEARFAEGRTDRLPALAAELVRLKMDVIATFTTPAALAAKQATTTIPIVFGGAADPVGSKIVSNLARPGGNITGWTQLTP